MKTNQLTALTGIRFLAAFYIFLFHMDMRIPMDFLHPRLTYIIQEGPVGVNIFFVLSGFILTYTYYKKKINYRDFFLKRFVRIYPAYLAGLLLCLLVFYPGLKILLLNVVLATFYSPHNVMQWYGDGAWSISTEFFFYFLFLQNNQKRVFGGCLVL